MDLNQLLYRRLSQDNLLNGTLSKYADKPAIFNTEFPPDQQEGWNGKSQYPRISYVFNKQVDTKRSSSGQLTVALYDIMDPLEVEKMEVAIRNCLQDVVMKPEGEALCALHGPEANLTSWKETQCCAKKLRSIFWNTPHRNYGSRSCYGVEQVY